MADDKLEFEATASGGKISVSGPQASQVSAKLGDLLSPFTELAGLAGDHIRIYRYESVTRRLDRAREIAAERGTPIQPVHPKNLIPWLENASLENDSAGELGELWSRLLLSGAEEFDAELAIFTDSLKRIGRREAELLKKICLVPASDPRSAWEHMYVPTNIKIINKWLELVEEQKASLNNVAAIFRKMEEGGSELYVKYIYLDMNAEKSGSDIFVADDVSIDDIMLIADVLAREDLVRLKTIGRSTKDGRIEVVYMEGTPLGIRLMARCHPELFALRNPT